MIKIFFLSIALYFPFFVYSQSQPVGGGEFRFDNTECLSSEARGIIQAELDENIARLESQGAFTHLREQQQTVSFGWPLQMKAGETDASYYGISNFVDQNTAPTAFKDYYCNNRTYDGHHGTDIFTWPFQWNRMDNNTIQIIAAEAGVIISKVDGFEDHHCACINNDWNAVYLRHADNSVTWYGHMKKNSQTTKAVGQSVAKGEFLGIVGSSGCSTGPHLHFEVYNSTNSLIDPFQGSCNTLNSTSWWANQKPWRDPTLNRVQLGITAAGYGNCTTYQDTINETYSFAYGNRLYVTAFFHDQSLGNVSNYTIYRPDNSVFTTWSHTSPDTYNASWWYWYFTLPNNSPGTWRVVTTFLTQTVEKKFTLAQTVSVEQTEDIKASFYPSPFSENLNLDYQFDEKATVELFDIQGRMLKTFDLETGKSTHTLPTENLPRGIYIAKIKTSKQPFIQKVIKE